MKVQLYVNGSNTADADPYAEVRDYLEWTEGLWHWGATWRDEYRRHMREEHKG